MLFFILTVIHLFPLECTLGTSLLHDPWHTVSYYLGAFLLHCWLIQCQELTLLFFCPQCKAAVPGAELGPSG